MPEQGRKKQGPLFLQVMAPLSAGPQILLALKEEGEAGPTRAAPPLTQGEATHGELGCLLLQEAFRDGQFL